MRFSDHRGLDPKDIQIIDGMFTAKSTQGTRVCRTDTSRKKEGFDIVATLHYHAQAPSPQNYKNHHDSNKRRTDRINHNNNRNNLNSSHLCLRLCSR